MPVKTLTAAPAPPACTRGLQPAPHAPPAPPHSLPLPRALLLNLPPISLRNLLAEHQAFDAPVVSEDAHEGSRSFRLLRWSHSESSDSASCMCLPTRRLLLASWPIERQLLSRCFRLPISAAFAPASPGPFRRVQAGVASGCSVPANPLTVTLMRSPYLLSPVEVSQARCGSVTPNSAPGHILPKCDSDQTRSVSVTPCRPLR